MIYFMGQGKLGKLGTSKFAKIACWKRILEKPNRLGIVFIVAHCFHSNYLQYSVIHYRWRFWKRLHHKPLFSLS